METCVTQRIHLCNTTGRRICDKGARIPDSEAEACMKLRMLQLMWGYSTQKVGWLQSSRSILCQQICNSSPAFQRYDFEFKPAYFTLVGQAPFHSLSHEHPMDQLEQFEDLVSAKKVNGVHEDYLLCKLSKFSFAGDASYLLKKLEPGSLTS